MKGWKNWNERSRAKSNNKKVIGNKIKLLKLITVIPCETMLHCQGDPPQQVLRQDTKTKILGIKRRSGGIELVNQVLRENNRIEK